MTRRIVLSVLLLIAAVIGAVAVPLGLLTASQDRHDFTDETTATASTLANVAEERLDDGSSPRALHRLIRQLGRDGDKIGVFDKAGRLVYGTRPAGAVSLGQLAVARGASTPLAYPGDGSLLVVAPVRNDDETGNVGTVALQRPTTTVDHRITVLWWLIGLTAAIAIATVLGPRLASPATAGAPSAGPVAVPVPVPVPVPLSVATPVAVPVPAQPRSVMAR